MAQFEPKGERIADYAFLSRGRKYWNIWLGNPFFISLYKVPLSKEKETLIAEVKEAQSKEKIRFLAEFPGFKWESI